MIGSRESGCPAVAHRKAHDVQALLESRRQRFPRLWRTTATLAAATGDPREFTHVAHAPVYRLGNRGFRNGLANTDVHGAPDEWTPEFYLQMRMIVNYFVTG
jgi:hypothetical protein